MSNIEKICTGCGRSSLNPIGEQHIACCPDNNYIEMSKDKQIMKLYTETEIVSFLKKEFADEINAETFMENLTPIELPSDEEILKRYIFYIDTEIQLGFLEESQGARLKWYYTKYFSKWYYTKYFSNKIQGGNNEQ